MENLKQRTVRLRVLLLFGVLLIAGPFLVSGGAQEDKKTIPVTVVNSSAQPVPVTGSLMVSEREFANRQPFQFSIQANLDVSEGAAVRTFSVPAGRRLVIEHMSCEAAVPPGQRAMCHFITTVGGTEAFHLVVMSEQGNFVGSDQFRASQAIRTYADPETLVRLVGQRNEGGGTAILDFTISGYLVPVP